MIQGDLYRRQMSVVAETRFTKRFANLIYDTNWWFGRFAGSRFVCAGWNRVDAWSRDWQSQLIMEVNRWRLGNEQLLEGKLFQLFEQLSARETIRTIWTFLGLLIDGYGSNSTDRRLCECHWQRSTSGLNKGDFQKRPLEEIWLRICVWILSGDGFELKLSIKFQIKTIFECDKNTLRALNKIRRENYLQENKLAQCCEHALKNRLFTAELATNFSCY